MEGGRNLHRSQSLRGLNKDLDTKSSNLFGTPRRALGDVKNNFGTPKLTVKAGFSHKLNFDEDDNTKESKAICSKQLEFGDSNGNILQEKPSRSLKPLKNAQQEGVYREHFIEKKAISTDDESSTMILLELPKIQWDDPNLTPDYCSCPHDHENDLYLYHDFDYLKTLPIPIRDAGFDCDSLNCFDLELSQIDLTDEVDGTEFQFDENYLSHSYEDEEDTDKTSNFLSSEDEGW